MSFIAQFKGECSKCGGEIKPGQEVLYGAFDELVHVFCPNPPGGRPVCGVCFEELPLTDKCGNCDD